MSETIYARFDDYKNAERAVGALLDHGVDKDDVSLLTNQVDKDGDNTKHEGHAKNGITTTTGADAASGAAKGAGVGLVVGALGALASLTIPGFGLVTGGAALATALGAAAGTTAAGAVSGGVAGFLQDQGVAADAAAGYEEAVKNGGALVSVSVPSKKVTRLDAEQILAKYGVNSVNAGGPLVRTAV